MALIVLTSASGSPGVTTTALALALTWRRPALLVEADPTGGSAILAGYFRGRAAPTDSLIDLAFAHRDGTLVESIPSVTMAIPDTGATLIPGTRAHGQARSLTSLWEPLAQAFKSLDALGQDVIVDAGRLGLQGSPDPLLYGADLALLVTRTDLVALAGARSWAETLRGGFEQQGTPTALGLLTIGDGRPYTAREVTKVLQVPVLASVAWDEASAAVFARGADAPRKLERSALLRSLRSAQDAITTTHHGQPGTAGWPKRKAGPDEHRPPPPRRARCRRGSARTRATCRSSPRGTPQRPGRVRGAFTMTPVADRANRTPAVPVARAAPRPFTGDLDWGLVAAFRQQASDRLSAALGEDRAHTTTEQQRHRGRAIIAELLEAEAAERIGAGVDTWSGRGAGRDGHRRRGRPVRAGPPPAAGRRRPGREHHHHRPRPGHPRADRRATAARPAGGRQRPGADRLPGLPGLAQRGQRPPVLRGAATAAPAPGRRRPAGRRGLGDAPPVGGDPPPPAAQGHPGRPGRPGHPVRRLPPRSCRRP